MSKCPFDDMNQLEDLAARLRRCESGSELAGIAAGAAPPSLMTLPAQQIAALIDELTPISRRMARLRLSSELRRVAARIDLTELRMALLGWQQSLTTVERRGRAIPAMPAGAALEGLLLRLSHYNQINRVAAMALNRLLDVRLLWGTVGWLVVRSVMRKVVARLEDPEASRDEKAELQHVFGPLLIYQDQVLIDQEQRRAGREAAATLRQAERQQAQEKLLVTEVMHMLRMGVDVERETLIRAAVLWKQQQQEQARRDRASLEEKTVRIMRD